MKRRAFASSLAALGVAAAAASCKTFELNYDNWIHLDAEDLAEQGIQKAYEKLRPVLLKYLPSPAPMQETVEPDKLSYVVVCGGISYDIYSGADEYENWGVATFALFDIINRQLANTKVRFFAINAANDLGGMMLTPAEAEAAKASLPKKSDWPYLPTRDAPWFGFPH